MFDFVSSFWPFLIVALLVLLAIAFHKKNTFFYWAARVLAIFDIIYLAWESLEIKGYDLNNFFSANILTSIPLLIILLLGWRRDLIGAIGFALAGAFFLVYFEWGDFPIGIVPILIGGLFTMSWRKKQQPH